MICLRSLRPALFLSFLISFSLLAQTPEVDVTFFYEPSSNPSRVFVPGEFNNWGPNNNGNISPNAPSLMEFDAETGRWFKTVRLRVGGQPGGGVTGAYQYKFNENGTSNGWLPDPLNPRTNPDDNNNSLIFVKDPTIFYLLPNSVSGSARTATPEITAYIFPTVGNAIDTSSIRIFIDNTEYAGLGSFYDRSSAFLRYTIPDDLEDGTYKLKLVAASTTGSVSADSTSFRVRGNPVQFLTQPATTRKDRWVIRGVVFKADGTPDSSVTTGRLTRNGVSANLDLTGGRFEIEIALIEGANDFTFQAEVGDISIMSSPLVITRIVDHEPFAVVTFELGDASISLSASESTDPDPGQTSQLVYTWMEDAANPEVFGIDGQQGVEVSIPTPGMAGEYYFTLTARDPDGNEDRTRQFLRVEGDGEIVAGDLMTNPAWVRDARIYILFFKGLTPAGTIPAAMLHLERIQELGFNVIWTLPVMDNAFPIDNGIGPGYNIVDFFNVAPEYGTNEDFKAFVERAHELGLKVILDVTPNHSGRLHPFAAHAREFGIDSQYWPYYQHQFISHNTNSLGQSVDAFGFYYYSGFSDQLLNWDWRDIDGRTHMIEALEYWLEEFDLDGYRLDVYWGPHRKYGRDNFDRPLRRALKHVKPDILLLAEDDGTGPGTEVIYADQTGGADAGYDFKLFFNQIRNFGFSSSAVTSLHNELNNGGYYPGENSYYFRFMETQDEDRITHVYNSFERSMPVASVLFTAPGIPGIMQGQEVGYGKGIPGSKEDRVRSVVDFSFEGRDLLYPHYQRIVQIRKQFQAFRQHKEDTNEDGSVDSQDDPDFIRVNTTDGLVYAFARPFLDHNGLTVVNFASSTKSVTIDLTASGVLEFSGGIVSDESYFLNDLYNDSNEQVTGAALDDVQVTLPGYGTAIFVVSQEEETLELPVGVADPGANETPREFALHQSYPNPFLPALGKSGAPAQIRFDLPTTSSVKLEVFDAIGRRVKTLFLGQLASGAHAVSWDGKNDNGLAARSGVYILRLQAGERVAMRKLLIVK